MKPSLAFVACIVVILFFAICEPYSAPTNTITKEKVRMASPPSALEAPAMDGMALRSNTNTIAQTNAPAPTFADGVLIAVGVLRSNPGFATLLTPQEQVALCARVWQQARSAK